MLLTILFSILAGVVAIFCFFHQKHQTWRKLGVPYMKPHFFYGNAKGVGTTIHTSELLCSSYEKLKSMGPFYGLYIIIRRISVITDLELIKTILVKNSANFLDRGLYYNEEVDPLSAHLIHLGGDEWQSMRNKISPTFTSGKMKTMYPTISEVTDRAIKKINSESGSVDVNELFGCYTCDVIGSCAFGIECNSLEEEVSTFHETGKAVLKYDMVKYQFCFVFQNLAKRLGLTVYPKWQTDFYIDTVKKTIDYRDANPLEQRKDFLNLLMALRDPSSPNPLTLNQIAAQAFSFFIAGFDTTANALTYCTYQLATNKDIQEKARKSVLEVLEKHENILTYECVSEMKYLDQCIHESMRIYPVGYMTTREVKEDYQVPNTSMVLEKGSTIFIPIIAILRDPDYFPDPLKFDPDRFSPEEISKRNPFTFIPFGEGPRICIGKRFSTVVMKLVLAQLLINFEFTLDRSKTNSITIDPETVSTMNVRDEVFVNFRKR